MNELLTRQNRKTRVTELLPAMNVLALLMIWRSNYCTSSLVIALFPPIIFIVMFAVWFIFAMITDATFLRKLVDKAGALMLFIIINMCLDLFFSMTIKVEMINCLIALVMFAMMIFYSGRKDCEKFKRLVLVIIIIDLLIKILYSINEILINPAIVKQMSTAGANENREVSILVADYSTVYTCVVIAIFMFGLWKRVPGKGLRRLTFICALILTYFIFVCSFFFALILFVYGIAVLFFIKRKVHYITFPIVVLLLILIFKQPIASFCWQMSQQPYWNDIMQGKWNDMYMLLTYGSDAAYMSDMRLDLMQKSLETFIKYPLLGVYSFNISASVGRHSAWLDGLASYGIVRYALFLAFLISLFKELLKDRKSGKRKVVKKRRLETTGISKKRKRPLYAAISIYILLSVVNPNVFPQIWVTFCVLIPFYNDIVIRKTRKRRRRKHGQYGRHNNPLL